jgi:Holliday junction resolvase RusA-like endonuclease
MEYKFTFYGVLPNLNDYLQGERIPIRKNGKFTTKGNAMKQENQRKIIKILRRDLLGLHIQKPIEITYKFYELNRKRDLDNISAFAHKVIQDALVKAGTIENDGWKHIRGFSDEFYVDSENPRIEITLKEVD